MADDVTKEVKVEKRPANEFIIRPGVSAWDDIDGPDDDEWAKSVRKLLAERQEK